MTQWLFFPEDQCLVSNSRNVRLTRRASEVLSVLVENKGEVVGHDHLLDTVWHGINVTPDLVREYIFDLRQALGDDASDPTYIETLRSRGFRLFGDVSLGEGALQGHFATSQRSDMRAIIAILHPRVPDSSPELAGFAAILVDGLRTDLASHHDISVVGSHAALGPTAAKDARVIGRELGVGYVLDSSLAPIGSQVRATFHLIDTDTGRHVWAERFDHMLEDAGQLADTISKTVVNTLGGWKGELHRAIYKSVLRKDQSQLNSFEHFIRACDLEMQLDAHGIARSLRHLNASLQMDPGFARAWVVKSVMLQWAYDVMPTGDADVLRQSEASLDRAIELDPADPITSSLFALKCARAGDLVGAHHAIDTALARCRIEADACMTTATACAVVKDDFDTAEALLATAYELNPAPPSWYRFVEARVSFFLGDDARAIAASLAAPPHVTAFVYRALAQANLNQNAAALHTRAELMERFPRFSFQIFADYFPIAGPVARGRFDTAVGRLDAVAVDVG